MQGDNFYERLSAGTYFSICCNICYTYGCACGRGWTEKSGLGLELRLGAECAFSLCAVLFLFWLFFRSLFFYFHFVLFLLNYTCFRLIAHTTHIHIYTPNSIISISIASKSPRAKSRKNEQHRKKQREIKRNRDVISFSLTRSLSIRVWCLASSIISISANGFVVASIFRSFISLHIFELHFIAFRHIFYLNIAFFSGIFFDGYLLKYGHVQYYDFFSVVVVVVVRKRKTQQQKVPLK